GGRRTAGSADDSRAGISVVRSIFRRVAIQIHVPISSSRKGDYIIAPNRVRKICNDYYILSRAGVPPSAPDQELIGVIHLKDADLLPFQSSGDPIEIAPEPN